MVLRIEVHSTRGVQVPSPPDGRVHCKDLSASFSEVNRTLEAAEMKNHIYLKLITTNKKLYKPRDRHFIELTDEIPGLYRSPLAN